MPDHCSDDLCRNGGVCVDGHCSCLNGFEGTTCEERWHTRFIGKWISQDNFPGDANIVLNYEISVEGNEQPDRFWILGLNDRSDSVLCRRKSYLEFIIEPGQKLDDVTLVQSGSGVFDSLQKTVALSYTLQRNDSVVTYQASWVR